jgi:hypothetical protein
MGRPLACSGHTLAAWLFTVFALIAILAQIGSAVQGRRAGVLIDNRNRMSLSKAQMLGWTVLILSGTITVSAAMLSGLESAPTRIILSTQLLTLMGISLGTAAATPALLSVKNKAEVDSNETSGEAGWSDLVKGDDTSNADAPDVSKIQQLLMTLIVMGVYMFQLGNALRYGGNFSGEGAGAIGLPELRDDLVWLVGLSHGGYLAYKAVPHTTSDASANPPAGAAPVVADGAVG